MSLPALQQTFAAIDTETRAQTRALAHVGEPGDVVSLKIGKAVRASNKLIDHIAKMRSLLITANVEAANFVASPTEPDTAVQAANLLAGLTLISKRASRPMMNDVDGVGMITAVTFL